MKTIAPRRKKSPLDDLPPSVPIITETWREFAACGGVTTDIFFSETDEVPSIHAVTLCHTCPVKADCLQHALTYGETGYWGGTTETQRRAMLSGRLRVKCPACSGRDIIEFDNESVCIACGVSW